MRKYFYLCLVLMTIYGCSNKGYDNKKIIGKLDIDFTTIEAKTLFDVIDIKKVIKLKLTNQSAFGEVDAVQFDKDENIYIGDYYSTKRVLRFDKNGNYVRSYGKVGEAPGEFTERLTGFCVLNDKVNLFASRKLVSFSSDGTVVYQRNV